MCLAVPAKIISINGLDAQVSLQGAEVSARLDLVEGVGIGDWVLLHAGYAIQVLSEQEAWETLELWEELEGAGQ
jgi:hydrogenase expression/formation protein HypC